MMWCCDSLISNGHGTWTAWCCTQSSPLQTYATASSAVRVQREKERDRNRETERDRAYGEDRKRERERGEVQRNWGIEKGGSMRDVCIKPYGSG